MYYVYVLFSKKDGQLYLGSAPDLKARKRKHDLGYVPATQYRRPLVLIYYEAYVSAKDAGRRERFLKGGKGHAEMKVQLLDTYKKMDYHYRD